MVKHQIINNKSQPFDSLRYYTIIDEKNKALKIGMVFALTGGEKLR